MLALVIVAAPKDVLVNPLVDIAPTVSVLEVVAPLLVIESNVELFVIKILPSASEAVLISPVPPI